MWSFIICYHFLQYNFYVVWVVNFHSFYNIYMYYSVKLRSWKPKIIISIIYWVYHPKKIINDILELFFQNYQDWVLWLGCWRRVWDFYIKTECFKILQFSERPVWLKWYWLPPTMKPFNSAVTYLKVFFFLSIVFIIG